MAVNALVKVSDPKMPYVIVDMEPVIDATCDTALIKSFSTGGFKDKDVLRKFLPDLGNPQPLRDLLDWADFQHHEITTAFVEADWMRYLRENRPGIIEKAKTSVAAAVTINDYRHAAALSKLMAWRYLTFAQVGLCMVLSLLVGLVPAENLIIRAFFATLAVPVLLVCVSAIWMYGNHNSASNYYEWKEKLKGDRYARVDSDWVGDNNNEQEE